MSMRILVAPVLLGFSFAANALTIDFEEINAGQDTQNVNLISSQGFEFASDDLSVWKDGAYGYPTQYLTYGNPGSQTMLMAASNGGTFSLVSADIFSAGATGNDVTLNIIGNYATGGSVSIDISVFDNIINHSFGTEWENLSSVTFGNTSFGTFVVGLDNVNVVTATVPIPATVWLFGSALTGLGWIRRKQTT